MLRSNLSYFTPLQHVACLNAIFQVTVVSELKAAAPGTTKLGMAGLGIMGTAMVRNLIKAGYEVHVWNRNPEKVALMVAEGAKVRPICIIKPGIFPCLIKSRVVARCAKPCQPELRI